MSVPVKTETEWTFEEFLENAPKGYKCEWVEGRVRMSPTRMSGHAAQRWLENVLDRFVAERGLGFVSGEQAILSGPAKGRVPDVYFVRAEREEELLDNPREMISATPDLLIEVLSERPRDVERDRSFKMRQYFEGGAEQYWLVDLEARAVEVYERGEEGFVLAERLEGPQPFRPGMFPGLEIELGDLWRRMERVRRG